MSGKNRLKTKKIIMKMRRVYVRSRCCCVLRRSCRECGPAVTCATVRGPVSPTPVVRGSHTTCTAGTRYRDVSGTPPLPLHNEPTNTRSMQYIHKHCRSNTTAPDGTVFLILFIMCTSCFFYEYYVIHNMYYCHFTKRNSQ